MSIYVGLEDNVAFDRLFNYIDSDRSIQSLSLVNHRIRNVLSAAIKRMVRCTLAPSFSFVTNHFSRSAFGSFEADGSRKEQLIVQTCNHLLTGKEPSGSYIGCLQEIRYTSPEFDKLLLLIKKA